MADESQTIESVAHRVPVTGRRSDDEANLRYMHVLASGPIPPNPTDLIESDRMHSLIRTAEQQYDLVVIDTPPTSVVSDAIPLIKQVSGVIVVSRLNRKAFFTFPGSPFLRLPNSDCVQPSRFSSSRATAGPSAPAIPESPRRNAADWPSRSFSALTRLPLNRASFLDPKSCLLHSLNTP